MTDDARASLSKRGKAELALRREREAAALRANLRRRKQQQRPADELQARTEPAEDMTDGVARAVSPPAARTA